MMNNIRTILFDLDGTILDTNELIIRSFMEVLEDVAPESFGRDMIIPGMGNPLENQLKLFSGYEDVTKLVDAYREVNLRLHDDYVKPFDHVQEVLAQLHKDGIRMGVVTTKMRLTTEKGLKFVGIYDYMDAIVTIDDVQHPKPHPEPIQKALKILDADPTTTIMLGDNPVDMQAAVAAGTIGVGVSWSLKGGQLLKTTGASYVIEDMRELYSFVGMEQEPIA